MVLGVWKFFRKPRYMLKPVSLCVIYAHFYIIMINAPKIIILYMPLFCIFKRFHRKSFLRKNVFNSKHFMNHQQKIKKLVYAILQYIHLQIKGLVITITFLPCKYRRITNVFAVECSNILWNFILTKFRFLIWIEITDHMYH